MELTFTDTKGNVGPRTVILVFAASYLATYLEHHRNRSSPGFQNSHLFIVDKVQQVTVGKRTEYVYKALDPDTIRLLLKDIAERAHIKKRVYPHLFRHCRATQLSQKFTEPKLRGYMGWAPGSSMPSRYTHLSAQDMENAIYEMYGLIPTKEQKGLEVAICKRCKKPVPAGAKFCYNCYYPISADVEMEIQQKMIEVYSLLSIDPTLLPEIIAKLQIKMRTATLP